jgi:hypothetical protein
MLNFLTSLAEDKPSRNDIPFPTKAAANRIRREFYSLKRALMVTIDRLTVTKNLTSLQTSLLQEYSVALRAFSLYQIAVTEDPSSFTGEVTLSFESRDETDLMQIFKKAIDNAKPVYNTVSDEDLRELERLTGKPAPLPDPDFSLDTLPDPQTKKPSVIDTFLSPTPSPTQEPSPESSNAVEQRYEEIMENHKAAAKAQRANLLSNTPTEEENKVGNPYY